MLRRRRLAIWLGAAVAAGALCWWVAAPYARSAAFILDLSGRSTWVRRLLPAPASGVVTRDVRVPTRAGPIDARIAEPAGGAARTVIVFPGVHAGGVDEPRLATFARRLASTGVRALSVPIPDLRAFRITPRATDVIEDAITWAAADRTFAPDGRIGVAGISFAGGLALVAAGRPSLAGRVRFLVSIGGYADLPRVMRYLCTGELADGTARPPLDYGVAVILLGAVARVVPAGEADALAHAVTTYLTAASDTETDPARADREFADARRQAASLDEPARTYMGWVNDRNTAALGRLLLPDVNDLGDAPALSPDRSPATGAPVFLLHGATDSLIPPTETPALAAYLEARGDRRVRWLVTPLLTHATVEDGAPPGDVWRLISFWTAVLDAAGPAAIR